MEKKFEINDDEFTKELLVAYAQQNSIHILEV